MPPLPPLLLLLLLLLLQLLFRSLVSSRLLHRLLHATTLRVLLLHLGCHCHHQAGTQQLATPALLLVTLRLPCFLRSFSMISSFSASTSARRSASILFSSVRMVIADLALLNAVRALTELSYSRYGTPTCGVRTAQECRGAGQAMHLKYHNRLCAGQCVALLSCCSPGTARPPALYMNADQAGSVW
jgi:hypothetical protein